MIMFVCRKHSFKLSYFASLNYANIKEFHTTYAGFIRSIASSKRKTEIRTDFREASVTNNIGQIAETNTNFFGIESDEGVIIVDQRQTSTDSRKSVYEATRKKRVKEEKFHDATFGIIRRDRENLPHFHGQFEDNYDPVLYKKGSSANEAMSIVNEIKNEFVEYNKSDRRKQNFEESILNVRSQLKLKDTNYNSLICDNMIPHTHNSTLSNSNEISHNNAFSTSTTDEDDYKTNLSTSCNTKEKEVSAQSLSATSFVDDFYFQDCLNNKNGKNIDHNYSTSQISEMNNESEKLSFIDELYIKGRGVEEHVNQDVGNSLESRHFSPKIPENNAYELQKHKIVPRIKNTPMHRLSNCDLSEKNVISERNVNPECNNLRNKTNVHMDKVMSDKKPSSSYIDEVYFQNVVMNDQKSESVENHSSQTNAEFISVDSHLEQKTEFITNDHSNIPQSGFGHGSDINLLIKNNETVSNSIGINAKQTFHDNSFGTKCNVIRDQRVTLKTEDRKSKDMSKFNSSENSQLNILGAKIVDYMKTANIHKEPHSGVKEKNINEVSDNSLKKESAYNFVKQLRNERSIIHHEIKGQLPVSCPALLDSKGFRILKNQVPDLSKYTRDEILSILVENILYSNDDVVVLNKPYNLVIHESKTTKDACLSTFLPDLAKELDKRNSSPELFTVHRLDKETTGCFLLARNETMAQNLKLLFAQRKILKNYWIITSKVPDPLEGIIDIPIAEGFINKKSRMVLHPEIPEDVNYKNYSKHGKRAVTHYKVLSISGNAALVEVKPETGIKHQIRVHFGFGLSCPVLGDHKYSHINKLAPQKLPSDLLQKLLVRQSKVRHIPMHIHARSILVPEILEGRNLFVMAPLPEHMRKNLKTLKIKK